jgi:hypothetical protein
MPRTHALPPVSHLPMTYVNDSITYVIDSFTYVTPSVTRTNESKTRISQLTRPQSSVLVARMYASMTSVIESKTLVSQLTRSLLLAGVSTRTTTRTPAESINRPKRLGVAHSSPNLGSETRLLTATFSNKQPQLPHFQIRREKPMLSSLSTFAETLQNQIANRHQWLSNRGVGVPL